ncbi:hypothetical protein MPH_00953 [Macrophomina phaseolina MS6]|uniref:Uncharacterized protein n=1 Tax=Macrophomina phaseolina (strain MS6) TaxID=1126212 RepID=K2S456_MACPH|nr:hypothetical protein MPH_00953 [Macrophomina phaseolina MS6]
MQVQAPAASTFRQRHPWNHASTITVPNTLDALDPYTQACCRGIAQDQASFMWERIFRVLSDGFLQLHERQLRLVYGSPYAQIDCLYDTYCYFPSTTDVCRPAFASDLPSPALPQCCPARFTAAAYCAVKRTRRHARCEQRNPILTTPFYTASSPCGGRPLPPVLIASKHASLCLNMEHSRILLHLFGATADTSSYLGIADRRTGTSG